MLLVGALLFSGKAPSNNPFHRIVSHWLIILLGELKYIINLSCWRIPLLTYLLGRMSHGINTVHPAFMCQIQFQKSLGTQIIHPVDDKFAWGIHGLPIETTETAVSCQFHCSETLIFGLGFPDTCSMKQTFQSLLAVPQQQSSNKRFVTKGR